MKIRRTRCLLLAAASAALLPMAPVMAGAGAPASGAVFFGLDCGIEGEMHAVGYPPHYSLNAVVSAGPYVVNGMNAALSCTLRRDSPGGPVLTAWGVNGAGTGTVPAMVPQARQLSIYTGGVVGSLYLCSRVSWTSVDGLHSDTGCERASRLRAGNDDPADQPWSDTRPISKPQDHDLDDSPPVPV